MSEEVKNCLRTADAVCFDVDSTVTEEECIDELAKFCGKGDEIAKLTASAMSGDMTFQEALKKRLDIIRPTVGQIREFLDKKPAKLTPGIKELVALLHSKNTKVYLVSGGFHCTIRPIADQLNIPHSRIYANKLTFFYDGQYATFDQNQPTSRSGGKAEVVKLLKSDLGHKKVVIVGDGATDLEACPPADGFVGFGGNIVREKVKKEAKWFVRSFEEMKHVLET